MSLATRCTHCGTIFKVVQDQLKVSEGWVRCGRCNEVFNALPALFDLEKDPPPPRSTQTQVAEPPPPQPPPAFHAQAEPEPGPQTDVHAEASGHGTAAALASQGLLSDEELNLGIDSQPPSGWEPTRPVDFASSTLPPEDAPVQGARRALAEDDLALDPKPIEATTDFELDTAIAVDDNTPLEDVLAATSGGRRRSPDAAQTPPPAQHAAPSGMHEPVAYAPAYPSGYAATPSSPTTQQAWPDVPPEDLPSTDEADALDSRYLMPTERERRAPRRRGKGPEFADAQFPTDAMIDAEEDWASDFGPSSLEHETLPSPAAPPSALSKTVPAVSTAALRTPGTVPVAPLPNEPPNEDDLPTLPSRFADSVGSELAIVPAGQEGRAGKKDKDKAPEFMRRAQRKAFWRHPAVRGVLSLIAVSLLLALGLQLMHQFRDLVAAYHPASRPLLTQWCEAVGCKLAPPLRLEALQVDNLELVRTSSEGPDTYRLTVVVRNQASIDLAWPHVDLTLTDESGAVIARRVFSPTDAQWLDTADAKAEGAKPAAPAASVPTAAPNQRSTTLQWRLLAPDIKPAGYTAELFYP